MNIKIVLPVLTCLVLIVFILFQAVLPNSTASAEGASDTITIAGIVITETKKSEIQSRLLAEVTKWKKSDIVVQGTTGIVTIPSDYITFDISKTVDEYISLTSIPWYNFWSNNSNLHLPLNVSIDEKVNELLKEAPLFFVDETVEAIKEHSSYLKREEVQANEVELTKDILDRVSFEILPIVVDVSGISTIVETLNDTVILNGEMFSFLDILKDVTSHYTNETVNFVASTLYSAVLQSELDIQERHSQNRMPGYLQPGIEVKVNKNRNQDFAFINQTSLPIIISSSVKEGRLIVELYSFKSGYKSTYEVINNEIVEPRTIYRLSAELPIGTEKVIEVGQNGLRVEVYKRLNEKDGSLFKEELISRDFYPPKNKVIQVSSKSPIESSSPIDESTDSANEDGNNEDEESADNADSDNNDKNQNDAKDKKENIKNSKSNDATYDKGGNLITSDSK